MDPAAAQCVLVVDDQAAIRELFASFLRRAGIEVDRARDGLEASIGCAVRVPDAVVCDLEMPEMDGVAFCHSLRAGATTRAVPVVIVSGAGPLALGRALAAGCDAGDAEAPGTTGSWDGPVRDSANHGMRDSWRFLIRRSTQS